MTRRILTTTAFAALCAMLVAPAGASHQNPSTPAQTMPAGAPNPADALPALNAEAAKLEGEIRSAARDVAKDPANADLGAKYRDLLGRYRQVLAAQFVARSTGMDAAARKNLATTMIADAQTAIAGQMTAASLTTLTDLYTAGSSDAKATLLGNAQATLDIQRARDEVGREAERQAEVASWSATGAAKGALGKPDTLGRLKGLLDSIAAIDVERPNRPSYMNPDGTRATNEQRQIEVWRRRQERDAKIAEFIRLADNGAILDGNGVLITGDLRTRIGINAKLQLVEAMKANNIDLGIFGRIFGWNDQRGATAEQLLAGVQADNAYQVLQLIDPSTAGATPQQWARAMASVVRFSADRVHEWRGGKLPSPDLTGVSGQIYGNAVGRFFYENYWLKQQTGLDTVSQLVGYNNAPGQQSGALFYTDQRIDEFEKDCDAAVGALSAMASATSPSDLPAEQFKLLQRFGFIGSGPDGKPVFQVPNGVNVTGMVQGDLKMPGASMLDVITSGAAIKAIVMMAAPQIAAARVGLVLEALGASERAVVVGEFVTTAISNAALDAAYQRVMVGTVQWDQLVLDTVVLNTILPMSGVATNAAAGVIARQITSNAGTKKAAAFVISHALGLSSDTVLLTYWQGKVSGTGMTYENFLANAFTGVVMRGAPIYSNVRTIWDAIHGPSPDLAAALARQGHSPEDIARIVDNARFQEQQRQFQEAVDRLETVLGKEYLQMDLGDPALIAKVTEAAETGKLGFPDLKAVFGDRPQLQKLMDGVNNHRLALFDSIIATAQQRARADVNAEYAARAARLRENLAGNPQLEQALLHNDAERKVELDKIGEKPKAPGSKNVTSDIDRSIASTYLRNELKLVTDEVFRKNRPGADPATSAKAYDVNEYFDIFQVINRMRELKLDLTNVSVNEPGFGALTQSDAIVAAGLAADMQHMPAAQRVGLRKNRATGTGAARMNRLFDIAEARLARDEQLLNQELAKLGQQGLDTTNPDVLTRARDNLYGRRAQDLADLMATFERMDPKSPEYLKTAAMIEREWSYVKLAGIEAYTNFAGLDIVVNKAQMNDISIRELITGKVDSEQTAKVNKGRSEKNLRPVTDEARQAKITEALGEIKAQYGPDQFSGALDDQIRFIVDHVNAYYEGHESATQAGTALSKYAERSALFLKLAGRDMSTGQLKELDAIAGILVKARGNPKDLNDALAKFGGGNADAGIKKLAGLLSDTMPGLKGLFDPSMYLHNQPAVGGTAGTAATVYAPGVGTSWSAFQKRKAKDRQELARTYGANVVLQSIVNEQTSLQAELQQLEKEKAEDDRLAPAFRQQDFNKIRQLEDEAKAIQTELSCLPSSGGQVAQGLRDKAANVQAQLANYRGYRPAGAAALTPEQQRRDRRIASIKAQMADNVTAATTYFGLAQVEATRLANGGSFLAGGPAMGLDQISGDPNANVVGADKILPSAFDGLGKLWLNELETTGTIKPGPPVKQVTWANDWSKIPDVSSETFVSGDFDRLQIRITDYLQAADFDLSQWKYTNNADGSVSYTNKDNGQKITGRLVTKNELDPVSGVTFKTTHIVIDKPAGVGSANSTGGSLNFGPNGTFDLTPFPGGQIYPGLLIGNSLQLYSPGTTVDPNHPAAPAFITPFPFFTAPPRTAGGASTYEGLNIFGLPGTPGSGAAGSGFIFTPPPNTVGVMPGAPNDDSSVGPPFGWGEATKFSPDPKSSMTVEESTGALLIDLHDGPVGPVVTGSPVPGFQMFLGDLRTPVIQPLSSLSSPSALWGALRWLFEPRAGVSGALSEAWSPVARTRMTTAAPGGSAAAADQGAAPPLMAIFTSLGVATGDAFEVRAINDGNRPARLVGAGLVLEPLAAGAGAQLRKEMDDAVKHRGGKAPAPTIAHMVAYCAEYAKLPPPAGMAFRVASPEVQAKYGALRRVLDAEQRLEQLGKFVPDLDPQQYFQQLRQWALWSKAEGFTKETFAKEFVDHARKNFTAAKQPWTKAIESQIASLVPHRWQEIAMVLQEAAGR